jgi:heme/copper-type cytochrome/quinol oxidase subunit 4
MPAESIPVLAFIIAAFGVFIVTVGGVWIWTNLPDKQG